MQILHERGCGLDIHKRLIVACAITPGPDGRPQRELRSCGTMTADILQLGDWLAERGVSDVFSSSGSLETKARSLALACCRRVIRTRKARQS